jgi:succinate-semialdehyde dehydrogenase/glutarate-semialdehyde dehydrogenase
MSHAYPQLQLFINGQWLSTEGRKSEPVFNPVDESVLGDLPHASPGRSAGCLAGGQRGL